LAAANQVAFMQFSGDLISGYVENKSDMLLQMANWKRVVGYFAKYFPVYTTIGNHECILYKFADTTRRKEYWIPRFPFDSISIEKIFADEFVNPENGPFSEDGNQYDPDKTKTDFPTYKENVYHYEYGNTAVVTLNTEYWYTEAMSDTSLTSGNIHAYVMDNQLFWLENTIAMLEKNTSIEHIFVTLHSPLFPNGGHVADDMWYGGNNKFRAYVAGKPVEKGIIERRDQILNILVNKSSKVVAILTGDEHNYCKLELGPETIIYPENYSLPKIKLSRTIYQVNNGAAGAPYYAQEKTPWTNYVTGFTSRNALVLFDVEGGKISMRVINPDTLEPIDELVLRK